MIEAIKKGWFTNDVCIRQGERVLTELDVSNWRERAEFELEGLHFSLFREGAFSGAFVLEHDGEILGKAVKPSAFRDQFEIGIAGRTCLLKPLSMWKNTFGLFDGDQQIGAITPSGMMKRSVRIDLPEEFPVAVQVFLFWLVLILWNRNDSAGAT